jgi:hypothetical protein
MARRVARGRMCCKYKIGGGDDVMMRCDDDVVVVHNMYAI